jgi:hypothetical protein
LLKGSFIGRTKVIELLRKEELLHVASRRLFPIELFAVPGMMSLPLMIQHIDDAKREALAPDKARAEPQHECTGLH